MGQRQYRNSRMKHVAFWLLIAGLFFLLDMQDYLFLRPQGPHQWRQADCASFAQMYAVQNNGLLEPELHQLMSDNGTTGKTAGEFPLLYYAVGQLWKVTGQQEWLFRLINLLLFVGGLFSLFKLSLAEVKSTMMSLLLVAMVFTIPVFIYYAPNFLQNITAFSTVLIAWYWAYRFYRTNSWLAGILTILFFTLAPLLKITAFISILALFGVLVLQMVWPTRIIPVKHKGRFWLVAGLTAALSISVNVAWYTYVKSYVALHGGWFTFNDLWPIWKMEAQYIRETLQWVWDVWRKQYFSPAGYFFLLVSLFLIVGYRKQVPRFLWWMMGITFLGNLTYLLLWFNALHDHDYYLINLYFLPVLLWFSALYVLKKNLVVSGPGRVLGIMAAALLVGSSVVYDQFNLWYRYNGWMNDNGQNRHASFFDVTPYLRQELHIDRSVPVITYPDPSFSITLYLADQRGWPMRDSWGGDFIESKIKMGAQYILVNDSSFYQKEGLEHLQLTPIGKHKKVDVLQIDRSPR
jgi:hypothetical protein